MNLKNTNKSVWVATPMYGGVCTAQYMEGIINSITALSQERVPMYWSYLTKESLITRGRNELVRLFLESEYKYMMFIDADIGFDGYAILKLLQANKDIICGVYPKKELDWEHINLVAKNGAEDLQDYSGTFVLNTLQETNIPNNNGVVEISHGGTGFMLIHRSVFEKLSSFVPQYRGSSIKSHETGEFLSPLTHEFFATSINNAGVLLSEDYHFCDLWRKHGGKVFACLDIKLEHVGSHAFSGNFFKSGFNIT
jgi:hypothetical protein